MTAVEIIALIAPIVLMLQNAAQIPGALTDLLRACLPIVDAVRDLIAAIKSPSALPANTDQQQDTDPP
ncbi:hypothetical protein ACGFIX_05430 [Nocardia salmonicida]|uniref:hypothetical protein n=1 Tax=Nocardia salmonicida TaxID=53431 RepID=UPI003724020B